MSEDYRTVTATIVRIAPESVAFRKWNERGQGGVEYIPRSLLHGADDLWLEKTAPRDQEFEWTFRLLDWKAEKLGLAG